MTKVLFVVTSFEMGGIETYIRRFLEYNNRRLQITVLSKTGRSGAYEKAYRQLGAQIMLLPVKYIGLASWWKFYKYLRSEGFSTICDFTGTFAAVPLFLSRTAGVERRVAFYRGARHQFKTSPAKRLYIKWSERLLLWSATRVLSNSISALDHFFPNRTTGDHRFEVIYNGIPPTKFIEKRNGSLRNQLNIPDDAFVVGHVGRYARAKNYETITRVAKILISKENRVFFLLCGSEVSENLMKKLNDWDIADRVVMPGICQDIPDFLNCMDVFLFPSHNEGQPNALIEAMYAELPVVASNIDPHKEVTHESMRKNLFSPTDARGMAERISKIRDGKHTYDTTTVKNWAMKMFDPDLRFGAFYDHLVRGESGS